jgi:hypothetical protein
VVITLHCTISVLEETSFKNLHWKVLPKQTKFTKLSNLRRII